MGLSTQAEVFPSHFLSYCPEVLFPFRKLISAWQSGSVVVFKGNEKDKFLVPRMPTKCTVMKQQMPTYNEVGGCIDRWRQL